MAKPEGPGPHPTLLMIHGGPYTQYSIHLFDETQVYVDAGYAVVYCNPRGSAGYGRDHGLSIREKLGTLDLFDVLDFLDGALAAHPDLDASRLGILGGSYGGYLTAWTIAHDHRFRAAIVERGFLDPDAFIGSSDIGWFFPQEYNGQTESLRRTQSPQAVAHQVTHADPRHPLGERPALPDRAGGDLLGDAQAAGRRHRDADLPRREPRAEPSRATAPPRAAVRRDPRVVREAPVTKAVGVHRLTSRVLLFDRDSRILLFLTTAPDTSGVARWITPGGGVDPGESQLDAALRELHEETGLTLDTVEGPVWSHDFDVQWDDADHDTGHAEFFTATVDAFEPSDADWTDEERVDVLAHKWWTLSELIGTDEPYEPAELIHLVRRQLPSC